MTIFLTVALVAVLVWLFRLNEKIHRSDVLSAAEASIIRRTLLDKGLVTEVEWQIAMDHGKKPLKEKCFHQKINRAQIKVFEELIEYEAEKSRNVSE